MIQVLSELPPWKAPDPQATGTVSGRVLPLFWGVSFAHSQSLSAFCQVPFFSRETSVAGTSGVVVLVASPGP